MSPDPAVVQTLQIAIATLWVAIATLVAAGASVWVAIWLAGRSRPHAHLRAEWAFVSTQEGQLSFIDLYLFNDGNAPARAIELRLNTYMPPDDAPEYVKKRPFLTHGYIAPNGEPYACKVILGPWLWEEGRVPQLIAHESSIGGGGLVTATVSYQPFDSRAPRSGKARKEKTVTLVTESPSVMW